MQSVKRLTEGAMKKKTTIKDVAMHSGVSTATVSNVLNNINNRVSEETKKKVLDSVKELNYKMDFNARSLAGRNSNIIGVMLPITEDQDMSSTLLTNNPFYSEFINGIEFVARQNGYDILITGVSKEYSCREWVIKRNLDGLIFLGMYPEKLYNEIVDLDIPVVLTDTYEDYTTRFHSIGIDDKQGAYLATKYLLELGHRKIAFVTGDIFSSGVNLKRFNGYEKALKEYNIPLDHKNIVQTTVGFDGGVEAAQKIIKQSLDVTAVFAVADIMAFGVIKHFNQNSIKVPDEISVIGFDDLKMCEYMFPALTTVKQDIFRKGSTAVKVLIDDIECINKEKQNIILPVKLIERESTKNYK